MQDYGDRLARFLVIVPIIIIASLIYINIRNSIDLRLNTKRIGNFKILDVMNIGPLKLVVLTGFRIFTIKLKAPYFKSVAKGQVISIKKTATLRLIDYYIRDEKVTKKN